jgi:glycosyltransferase involved in cell wall biosynthesis
MARGAPVSYLLICHSYPPVLGGSEIEAQRVSAELQRRGHRPMIVCAGGDPMPRKRDWVDPCGLHVRTYGHSGSQRRKDVVYALSVAWTLLKERKNYDVAYFLMHGLHLAVGLPVARLLNKPIVMKFSGSSLLTGMRSSWLGRLEITFLRWWAARILVLNPGMVDEAREVGLGTEKLGWMPNPVDTDQFRPCAAEERRRLRQELGVGPDVPVTVFVGRLGPEKRLPLILAAFARVVKELPEARLVLVGDGPLRSEVEVMTRRLGLESNIIRTGRLSAEGVVKWMQAADAFLLVSEVEGLPCSLIEAMSVGLVPVVSEIPAHTQIVRQDENGIIVELGNEESTARGLLRVLENPELRERLGSAARKLMIERFATARVVDRYETLFAGCLQR